MMMTPDAVLAMSICGACCVSGACGGLRDVVDIAAGAEHSCALLRDGHVECWGQPTYDYGQTEPPKGEQFVRLFPGFGATCGARDDGTLSCWGQNLDGEASLPLASYTDVSLSDRHACAVESGGTVVCSGLDWFGEATPPSGGFTRVSSGSQHTCGVRTDGTVACWGGGFGFETSAAPADVFVDVAASVSSTCGVRSDGGAISCWYSSPTAAEAVEPAVPPGTFASISAAGFAFADAMCAIRRDDDAIVCWGTGASDLTDVPSGAFRRVSVGAFHACAVRTDDTVACWGEDLAGETQPP